MTADGMKNGVYRIQNVPEVKSYYGQSMNSHGVGARWRQHRSLLRAAKHPNPELQADWTRLGEAAFAFELLTECQTQEIADEEERGWIELTRPDCCYNASANVDRPNSGTTKTLEQCHANARGKGATPFFRESLTTGEIKRYEWVRDAIADGFRQQSLSRCLTGERESYDGYRWYRDPTVPRQRGKREDLTPKPSRSKVVIGTAPGGSEHTFTSITEAAKGTGCGRTLITRVLNGQLQQTAGWMWRYSNDPTVEPKKHVRTRTKPVELIDAAGTVRHFDCVADAARFLDYSRSAIFEALAGRSASVAGCHVRYAQKEKDPV